MGDNLSLTVSPHDLACVREDLSLIGRRNFLSKESEFQQTI